jgi:hypothetical protein
MSKRVRIQLFSDGRVQADVQGVKGRKCTDYIKILEELLEAETADSMFTPEYFEAEELIVDVTQQQIQQE